MDNRKNGAGAGSGRPGEYEMLDRNMTGMHSSLSSQQQQQQQQHHPNVSRSDLDVLEATAPNDPYAYNNYSAGYHPAEEPSAPSYPADPNAGYFNQDGGVHFGSPHMGGQHGDVNDPNYSQAYKPLPTPQMPEAYGINRDGAPSPHESMQLHLARSAQATPIMSDDGSVSRAQNLSKQTVNDPRYMPDMDPSLAEIYNTQNAPPPNARKYKRYQSMRKRKMQKVALARGGNLVIDCPVPKSVLDMGKYSEGKEFTHTRYTAVTCDPNLFFNNNYSLRQVEMNRKTELFIVLTMYNEDDVLFNRTFSAVMKNIAHMCAKKDSQVWGPDGWKKVVVCIVSDGRAKIDKRVLATLGVLGVYQEGIAQASVGEKGEVQAHLFEYTTQVAMDTKMNFLGHKQNMTPVQVLFCLKEKNAKKINSHRWFFNAFAPVLKPNICVLIDVGTRPATNSIYHLWKSFNHDERVAGACGEIAADLGRGHMDVLTNPLVAAQNFEYKMSNILDKPLESVFGYISVLPGAFSAYRYSALRSPDKGELPLEAYFKGEMMHTQDAEGNIFEANMYLAEDRILCFELVAKRKCNYVLRYVKKARAYTDVPDNLAELISQRRRWLNGSFFASFYSIVHWHRVFGTSHSLYRWLMLTIEFIYQTVNMIFAWFAIANFYLAYFFLEQNLKTIHDSQKNPEEEDRISLNADPFHGAGYYVMEVFRELYILALILQFVLSLGNRPQGTKPIYRLSVALFTIVMIIITYVAIYGVVYTAVHLKYDGNIADLLSQEKFRDILISVASTYGLYIISSILYLDPWHMLTSFIQYLLWLPSSINILMVYAFCNTHDVSWGTKGDTGVATGLGQAKIEKKGDVEHAVLKLPESEEDREVDYMAFCDLLKVNEEPKPAKRDAKTKREDQNKIFRTTLVVSWMCTNTLLAIIISSEWFSEVTTRKDSTGSHNYYLSFIFWSVAGLSAFRFIGSLWYRIRFLAHD